MDVNKTPRARYYMGDLFLTFHEVRNAYGEPRVKAVLWNSMGVDSDKLWESDAYRNPMDAIYHGEQEVARVQQQQEGMVA